MRATVQDATTAGGAVPMVVVVCGPSLLAVPSDIVRGILEPDQAGPGPTVHAYGVAFPTTDLVEHLGLWRPASPPDARVILCERQHMRRAIHVDGVVSLTDVPQQDIQPLPGLFSGPERDWFAGLFMFEGRVALLINPVWMLQAQPLVTSIEDGTAAEPDPAPDVTLLGPDGVAGYDIVELRKGSNGEDTTWRHQ